MNDAATTQAGRAGWQDTTFDNGLDGFARRERLTGPRGSEVKIIGSRCTDGSFAVTTDASATDHNGRFGRTSDARCATQQKADAQIARSIARWESRGFTLADE